MFHCVYANYFITYCNLATVPSIIPILVDEENILGMYNMYEMLILCNFVEKVLWLNNMQT